MSKRSKAKDLSRLITSVSILGSEIDVQYVEELSDEEVGDCLGIYHSGEHLIQILDIDTIPYESQLSTLLHECIECINSKLEIDMPHDHISKMETTVFQLLRANPELCKAFMLYQKKG